MIDLKTINKTNAAKYNFACDWLQLHVYISTDLEAFQSERYLIKRIGQSKVFKDIYQISNLIGYPLATFATNANECIMAQGHGVLKFDNKQLYINPNLKEYVTNFLKHFEMRFIGITRLDLCFDFHTFHNLRSPQNFIKDFVSNRILKKQSTKFLCGGVHTDTTYLESISFGSKTSQCYYKLYNKTREMAAKVNKPYIKDAWNSAKLDHENRDVWRLEFTLNSDTATLLNTYHQQFKYHSLDALDLPNMYAIFLYCYKKHFQFVKAENKSRKDRMEKIILLELPLEQYDCTKIKGKQSTKDSTRATKIFIKKMVEAQQELKIFDDNFEVDAKEMVSKLISLYNLEKWAENKFISYNKNIDYSTHIDQYFNLAI